jgi:hypothetical protein
MFWNADVNSQKHSGFRQANAIYRGALAMYPPQIQLLDVAMDVHPQCSPASVPTGVPTYPGYPVTLHTTFHINELH